MLQTIITRVTDFLSTYEMVIAIVALAGLLFSGNIFYVASLLLVAKVLLPELAKLLDGTIKTIVGR